MDEFKKALLALAPMRVVLMSLNRPNLNGRVYSTEVMALALAECRKPLLIKDETHGTLAACVGWVKGTVIEGDQVLIDCHFWKKKWADQVARGELLVASCGIGTVQADGMVMPDYELEYLFLTKYRS